MTKPIHIALTEDDFRLLVKGEIVTTIGNGQIVKIILSDIGFDRMRAAITRAAINSTYREANCCERNCDHCGKPYRGPSVYCSHRCAIADA